MDFLPPDFINNFHFLRPLLLLLLIPALLLIIFLRFVQSQQSNWSRAIDPKLLPYLLDKSQSSKQSKAFYGLIVIWGLSIVALAGPVWEKIPVPVQEREDALVIVLDLSLSMYANDITPNRLTRARRKLLDVLNIRQEEGQTALVVYAGDAYTVTPLTDDVATIENMVPSLAPEIMPALGSRPIDGITLAIELLENSDLPEAQILLITDGINNSDIAPIQNLLANTNHKLSILGVGTEQGAPIPIAEGGFLRDQQNAIVIPRLGSKLLQDLANGSGGRYTDIRLSDEDLNFLLDQTVFDKDEDLVESQREYDSWHESGPWLLLLALPFAAFAFRRGWLLSIALLVAVGLPQEQAYAWELEQLWKNENRRASDDFIDGDYETAAELFNDEAWRAAANYRLQNYEQALSDLALQENADAETHYNRGNVLARLNRLEESITAYEQTLAQQPNHTDALHNKALVEDLLEQQEQEEQESESGENEEQDQDQQNQENQEQQESEEQQSGESDQESEQQENPEQEEQESEEETEQESEEESDSESEEEQDPSESEAEAQANQEMQQWLGRIEDDPGELLRNKFQYQSQQRLYQRLQNPNIAEQEAQQQIW